MAKWLASLLAVWKCSRIAVWGPRACLPAGPRARVWLASRPGTSRCFIFGCLAGSAFKMLSGALGPAWRQALAPRNVSLLRLQPFALEVLSGALGPAWRRALAPMYALLLRLRSFIWQCSRIAVWGARARLAAGPRAQVCLVASSSAVCLVVLSKCCLGRSGPPLAPRYVLLLRLRPFVWQCS